MGFLSGFFRRPTPNPTATWPEDRAVALDLELAHATIAGVGVNDRFEQLSFLGPGRPKPGGPDGTFEFPAKGLAIDIDGEYRIEALVIHFAAGDGFQPFPGRVLYQGQALPVGASTDERRFTGWFGEPYWRDEDEDDVLLFYEFGALEWQVEFAAGGGLRAMIIGPPLLADEGQRQAYGVTQPWPPYAER